MVLNMHTMLLSAAMAGGRYCRIPGAPVCSACVHDPGVPAPPFIRCSLLASFKLNQAAGNRGLGPSIGAIMLSQVVAERASLCGERRSWRACCSLACWW